MTHFEAIGGEEKIRALVDRFYDLMDECEEAAAIRKLHPEDLTESREKLYEFLVGWMGGPPLYVNKYGHPRLRARHVRFPIGVRERDEWLWCMFRAMDETGVPELTKAQLQGALSGLADFMRNKEG
ncbi:MAG: group II truncated hemoglobin [Acidobacteria bacterium]|nr:group II truncated hemoglobin [Acidobacteriota bacterium]